MPAKVAPLTNGMPPKAAHGAPAVGPSSSFLDVVLDNVCCAAESNNANAGNASTAAGVVLGERFVQVGSVERGKQQHQQQQQQQQQRQQQRPPLNVRRQLSQLRWSSQLDGSFDSSQVSKHPETIILPHLRFQPLPLRPSSTESESGSALKDFFDLFLADDAPHSFELFHESNGDEDVHVTPWKPVAPAGNCVDENADPTNDYCSGNLINENGKMERREIAFQTKITPGASSHPLSQSEHTYSNNSTIIPLRVTIVQSLLRLYKRWILECEFSFDFQPTKYSLDSSMGKKLGTGLGQYLMGNVVKGTTVNVAVTLTECDEIDVNDGPPPSMPIKNQCVGDDSVSLSSLPLRCAPKCNDDDFLPCLGHPLMLPPDGLCAGVGGKPPLARAYRRGAAKNNGGLLIRSGSDSATIKGLRKSDSRRNSRSSSEHPEQAVGAPLLSNIPANNAPGEDDGAEISASKSWLERVASLNSNSSRARQAPKGRQQEQALQQSRLCDSSSSGSLKSRNVPPTATPVTPMSNRNQLTPSTPGSFLDSPSTPSSANLGAVPSQGVSLRIEMELQRSGSNSSNDNGPSNRDLGSRTGSGTPSTTSSLSTNFVRSASISSAMISSTNIDEKIRRGLKKRVARSWIAWAESWCMKHWEEVVEGAGRARRRKGVRPAERRAGEKEGESPRWRRLQVESDHRVDRSVWMSLDREDECGVEVACTMSSLESSASSSPSLPAMDVVGPPSKREEKKQSATKRRLGMLKRG